MRQDMKKVLTERPRTRHSEGYRTVRRAMNRGCHEDLPAYQGMRRPYDYLKESKLYEAPLGRYLHTCVGRRFDEFLAELFANIPYHSDLGWRVRRYLRWKIDQKAYLKDGEVCSGFRWRRSHKVEGLYVDPTTGIICYAKPENRKINYIYYRGFAYCRGEDGILYPTSHWRSGKYPVFPLEGNKDAMQIDGIWYILECEPVPPPRTVTYLSEDGEEKTRQIRTYRFDVLNRENVHEGWYWAKKNQMSTNDMRRLGLKNLR